MFHQVYRRRWDFRWRGGCGEVAHVMGDSPSKLIGITLQLSHTTPLPERMAEPSTSTPTPEAGEVRVSLSLGVIGVENPAPVPAPAPEPKRPEPTIPYSWRSFQPPITFEYVTDCDRANELLAALEPCALGFDVEWKPGFLKGQPENKVALIQLANNDVIYLLQVSAMRSKSRLFIYTTVCMG